MRPKIICHMVSSVDGRLLVDRWTPPARGVRRELALGHYETVSRRFHADGWMVGRATIAEMVGGRPRMNRPRRYRRRREIFIAARGRQTVAVALDPRGKVHFRQNTVGGDHVVVVLGTQVSDRHLAGLRSLGISYLFAGPDGRDLKSAMDVLGNEFGLRTLLLEGGGGTNGSFLKAGLVDEISLLVYAGIDGLAGIPSIFEYVGRKGEKPGSSRALRHLATRTLAGGTVWLHYAVERAP